MVAFVEVPGLPGDILIHGTTAIVSSWTGTESEEGAGLATLIDLTDPANARVIGTRSGVGSRMALSDGNILFSTDRTFLKGTLSELDGVHAAALTAVAIIRRITPSAVVYQGGQPVTEKAMVIEGEVVPAGYELKSAEIEILRNGQLLETLPASISGASFTAVWPAGRLIDPRASYTAAALLNAGDSDQLSSAPRELPIVRWVLVDKRGREVSAAPVSDATPVVTLDPVTPAQVTLLGNGAEAQVSLSGTVTDPIADIVAEGRGDIAAVTVGEQSLAVTRLPEATSVTRPYAFKGRFSGTVRVPIDDGENAVSVVAKNAIGQAGAATVTVRVSQDVSVPPLVPDWSGVAPKLSTPLTLGATTLREDIQDTVVLAYGAVDPAGITEHLDETAAASLTFTGTTDDLGPATLVLETSIPPSAPGQLRLVSGQLTSLGLGFAGQSFEFLETASGSGVFRTPVPALPGTILRLSLGSMPDPGAIGRIRVKAGLDPASEPEPLEETAADSNVYTGTARGLGSVRIQILNLTRDPDEVARIRLFVTSSELGLDDYLLDMQEETVGSLEFTSAYVVLQPDAPPSPPTIRQSRVVGVEVLQGEASSYFEPVWVVATGATAFNVGETGQIDGRTMALTTAALPAASGSSAASYARLADATGPRPWAASYVRLADPVVFAVGESTTIPNVLSAPDAAGEDDPPPATHSVTATIQGNSFQAFFGDVLLNQLVAIKGTQSRPQIWLSKPASTIEIAGGGLTTGTPTVDRTVCPSGRPCQYRMVFPLTVTADALETRRDVRVRYTDGTEETFEERFHDHAPASHRVRCRRVRLGAVRQRAEHRPDTPTTIRD